VLPYSISSRSSLLWLILNVVLIIQSAITNFFFFQFYVPHKMFSPTPKDKFAYPGGMRNPG
jgi:hypothetical protein